MFKHVEKVTGLTKSPSDWIRLGESVLRHASNQRGRSRLGITEDFIESRDGQHEFRVISWTRRYGHDISLSLVDKRRAKLGLLVTACASSSIQPEHTALQAFAVNDDAMPPYRGLRRFKNDVFADDVVNIYLDAQQASVVREQLDQKPDETQLMDYAKALLTIRQQ